MTIGDILVRKIFDSRGEPTLEVVVTDSNGRSFSSQIPSGKSTGRGEARAFSFEEAEGVIPELQRKLRRKRLESVKDCDAHLLDLDGTPDKSRLGGNVMLGISIGVGRALAFERKKDLWEVLREEFFPEIRDEKKPHIFSNLINGGAHANNNLDIQEYMVAVHGKESYVESTSSLERLYKDLGISLRREKNLSGLPLGDEEGYCVDFEDNFEPIRFIENEIRKAEMVGVMYIALDAAASGFFKEGSYIFDGKELSRKEMVKVYEDYFSRSKVLASVEDPFAEDDPQGFRELRDALKDKWIVGDDLTVTDAARIEKLQESGSINAVIIKPNQIGTVSEACEAIRVARKYGIKTIVSHRSGETEDVFIIHLTKAAGADAVKIGAPLNERIAKFNELIRLYG